MTVLNTSAVLNRRSLLLGAALAGTTGLLAACSGGNGSNAGSAQSSSNLLESIKSAGKIRIGVEGTYRPYTYHDASGKLAGFEYDIAETLAKDLGVTAEYIETPGTRLSPAWTRAATTSCSTTWHPPRNARRSTISPCPTRTPVPAWA